MSELVYRIVLPILRAIFFVLFHPKRVGRENIPSKEPVLFTCNHKHAFDPIMIMYSTWRPIHFLAKKEHFKSIFGWVFRLMGCIYVDREAHDGAAVEASVKCLEQGKSVGIFPEGTRNRTKDLILQEFKYGAVAIARQTGVPIVPAAITGDYRLIGGNLMIRFGEPILVSGDADLDKANELLRKRTEELWRENLAATGRSAQTELQSRKEKKK